MNIFSISQLEYKQIKQTVMDYAISYVGKQYVEKMSPMTHYKSIRKALDETEEALFILKNGASVPIPSLDGMETVLNLFGTGYILSEQDFMNIHQFLRSCSQLKKYMISKTVLSPNVSAFAASLFELNALMSEVERCIYQGQIINSASKELGKIRKKITVVEERIKKKLDSLMVRHRSILQENFVSMRGNRYVIPIKKEYRKQLKGAVLDESSSGQTLYVEPTEISPLHYELQDWKTAEAQEESKILSELTTLAEASQYEMQRNVETVGVYDFIFAKAKYALCIEGRNVEINEQGMIDIQGGRHPLLSQSMIPLHFTIGNHYTSLIITGPNTGGKTVALKTVGLLTIMVQSGLLVPVKENSSFAIYNHVSAVIGDGQSLEQSLSTFSAHMKRIIETLNYADSSSLILIDEMASGTDPGEGVALSIAILEVLQRKGATVIVTTHYNEIKHFASVTPGFENARMEFNPETLQPLYKLNIGKSGNSYAFSIAKKLGISSEIIERSEEIMSRRGQEGGLSKEEIMEWNHTIPNRVEKVDERKQCEAETNNSSKEKNREGTNSQAVKGFELGDSVYVSYLKKTGIVYEAMDNRGKVGVLIQNHKYKINWKRLSLHIAKKDLYPADYDFDIIFESKEDRKKKKIISQKHVEGLTIIRKNDES